MNKKLLFVIGGTLVALAAEAAVYRWVDEEGKTRYSDSPPSGGAQVQKLAPDRGPSDDAVEGARERLEKALEEQRQREEARKEHEVERRGQKAAAEQEALQRQQDCVKARQDLATLRMQRRVYQVDERGERAYLDDQARAAEVERLTQEVERNCEP